MKRKLIRDLGNGLILRRSTVADTENLVAFHGDMHREPGDTEPESDSVYKSVEIGIGADSM